MSFNSLDFVNECVQKHPDDIAIVIVIGTKQTAARVNLEGVSESVAIRAVAALTMATKETVGYMCQVFSKQHNKNVGDIAREILEIANEISAESGRSDS